MRKFALLSVLFALWTAGCVTTQISPDAVDLSVEFTWQDTKNCSSKSPEIKVLNIPPETRTLQVVLTDLDVPSWNHGGGKVENDGSGIIPAGSLKSGYNGPCPPSGSHRYEFTVKALNSDGVIIGLGKAVRKFPM